MGARVLGIGWQPSTYHGWGVFGLNLAYELCLSKRAQPLFVHDLNEGVIALTPDQEPVLAPVLKASKKFMERVHKPGNANSVDIPVLAAADLDMETPSVMSSAENHAMTFQELSYLSPGGRNRGKRFQTIVAGSTWVGEFFRAQGFETAKTVFQGVDTRLFNAQGRGHGGSGVFTVFSGGKIEYRKAQDIVIKAFGEFHKRRPDTVLQFCWDNVYPGISKMLARGGLVSPPPEVNPTTRAAVAVWLAGNGLPESAFENLGTLPNKDFAATLPNVDVAVFPNRCEGGTNLVAMECMASGVPVILSANTGHLDLIDDDNCIPLMRQSPLGRTMGGPGYEQWRESDVEELVEALDRVYLDREDARRRGQKGAEKMAAWSWTRQTAALMDAIGF